MTALRILAVPFGAPGETSTGRILVSAGGISWPEDVSRVKLLVEHDRSEPVGVCSSLEETPDGIVGTFELGRGTLAAVKRAIEGVRSGLRDAASPGVDWDDATRLRIKRAGVTAVKAEGMLREVSLVAIGGFVDARVLEVIS
jgi:HK97 family phage prohead protease